MILNGPKHHAKGYIEGLDMLSSMRLCATTPMQHAIQTALGGYQSINEFLLPGGRLLEQRNKAWELVNQIPGVSCVKPMGALYMFPKIDTEMYSIHDDMKFIYDLLVREKVLFVQGTGSTGYAPTTSVSLPCRPFIKLKRPWANSNASCKTTVNKPKQRGRLKSKPLFRRPFNQTATWQSPPTCV